MGPTKHHSWKVGHPKIGFNYRRESVPPVTDRMKKPVNPGWNFTVHYQHQLRYISATGPIYPSCPVCIMLQYLPWICRGGTWSGQGGTSQGSFARKKSPQYPASPYQDPKPTFAEPPPGANSIPHRAGLRGHFGRSFQPLILPLR